MFLKKGNNQFGLVGQLLGPNHLLAILKPLPPTKEGGPWPLSGLVAHVKLYVTIINLWKKTCVESGVENHPCQRS